MLNVTEQLDAGVRYLDLRIAHMQEGSARNLHFVHMLYTAVLVEVSREVQTAGVASRSDGSLGSPGGTADLGGGAHSQLSGQDAADLQRLVVWTS